MKVLEVSGAQLTPGLESKAQAKGVKSFGQELIEARQKATGSGRDLYQDLVQMQEQILNSKSVPAKDLILYQIKTAQFGLQVELISKVGESALATIRKFQAQGGN